MQQGTFVISLDFELMWGVSDKRTLQSYGRNIRNVRSALESLLDLMDYYGIRASFASVGLLWSQSREEALSESCMPTNKPSYINPRYSNYNHLAQLTVSEEEYKTYYSGLDLLKRIQRKGQDIECHTYSHYYCLEDGQTLEQFDADLKLFHKRNTLDRSQAIIFPRNQYSPEYLRVCCQNEIKIFRGNELDTFHAARSQGKSSLIRRLMRFLDNYVNITGHHCYDISLEEGLLNVRASRFFRPPTRYYIVEYLKIRRIKAAMEYAAKNNTIYHLWWHPHNMGGDPQIFIGQMREIFEFYIYLKGKYGMQSKSMRDIYNEYQHEESFD